MQKLKHSLFEKQKVSAFTLEGQRNTHSWMLPALVSLSSEVGIQLMITEIK